MYIVSDRCALVSHSPSVPCARCATLSAFMDLAIAGNCHPASYDSDDIDRLSLIYELGGGATVNALHEVKPTSLPSVTNIRGGCRTLALRLSSRKLSPVNAKGNMHEMFRAKQAGIDLNGLLPHTSSSCIGEAKLLFITLIAFEAPVFHLAAWSESTPFVSCFNLVVHLACVHPGQERYLGLVAWILSGIQNLSSSVGQR